MNKINRRQFITNLAVTGGILIFPSIFTACSSRPNQRMEFEDYVNPLPFPKDKLPQPVFDKEPGFIDLYWKAWEIAWNHVKVQKGFPQSPYMDEAFWKKTIWPWDS